MGDWDHSFLQAMISHWFLQHRAEWKINVLTEYRTRTSKTRVRLPDICVVRQGEPVERVRVTAPLLCIEILSPEDRPGRVMKRLDDFPRWVQRTFGFWTQATGRRRRIRVLV